MNSIAIPSNANSVQIAMDQVAIEEKLFELAQRKANVYAKSSLVPKEYQNNIGNVLIAENMARRMGADTLMVMQNLYVVHGKPGWSAQFLIATFNSCGRFSAIKYEFTGDPGTDDFGCSAYAVELSTGEIVQGTKITIGMAKKEGWVGKNGSKWQTMPEQMMRYRAATFLIRATAPEIGMGLLTKEELDDMPQSPVMDQTSPQRISKLDDLTDRLVGQELPSVEAEVQASEPNIDVGQNVNPSGLIDELRVKLPSIESINGVKEEVTAIRAAIASMPWDEQLKSETDDDLCNLADERIAEIRANRGGK